MEDSEAPRPSLQHWRLGARHRRARLEARLTQQQVVVANERSPSQVIMTDNEAGSHQRIEILIRTETVQLAVDGKMTAESLDALAALANELRTSSPTAMAPVVGTDTHSAQCGELKPVGQGAGDHTAEPQAELSGLETPIPEANGQTQARTTTRVQQGVAATFRIAKDIVTELIARLIGHVLGFPP